LLALSDESRLVLELDVGRPLSTLSLRGVQGLQATVPQAEGSRWMTRGRLSGQ
jgi:uncharacterized protein YjiK